MIHAPQMLLIGSTGRNSGKTAFACRVIENFKARGPLIGAKVTAIREKNGECPRGGKGCGVCTSLEGDYDITEETETGDVKDTQKLLASGTERTLWLRVLHEHLERGARALLDCMPADAAVICESNSLRKVVKPGLFIMVEPQDAKVPKASAQHVLAYADMRVVSDGEHFDFNPAQLEFQNGGWTCRRLAAELPPPGIHGGNQKRV